MWLQRQPTPRVTWVSVVWSWETASLKMWSELIRPLQPASHLFLRLKATLAATRKTPEPPTKLKLVTMKENNLLNVMFSFSVTIPAVSPLSATSLWLVHGLKLSFALYFLYYTCTSALPCFGECFCVWSCRIQKDKIWELKENCWFQADYAAYISAVDFPPHLNLLCLFPKERTVPTHHKNAAVTFSVFCVVTVLSFVNL